MKNEFTNKLEFAFFEIQGSSGYSLDRNRPYNGQSHTANGIRGKTKIKKLTMRDISDCIVIGLLQAAGIYKKYPVHDDIYSINYNEIDLGAAIQNTLIQIEKMMNIYPNVPKLEAE